MIPAVHPTTLEWWESLGRAFTEPDAERGYPLLRWMESVGKELGYSEDVTRDTEQGSGWSQLLDSDRVKPEHLRFLGQFIGVRMDQGAPEAEKRARIENRENWERGKPATIRKAAQIWLTGSKTVEIYERDGSAYRLRVRTFAVETTDAAKLAAEIQKWKPGGLILTHEVVTGGTYAQLDAGFGTYADMDAAFADYNAQTNWVPA